MCLRTFFSAVVAAGKCTFFHRFVLYKQCTCCVLRQVLFFPHVNVQEMHLPFAHAMLLRPHTALGISYSHGTNPESVCFESAQVAPFVPDLETLEVLDRCRRSPCKFSSFHMVCHRFCPQALAEAVKVNKTLTKIDLSENNIGKEGAKAWCLGRGVCGSRPRNGC